MKFVGNVPTRSVDMNEITHIQGVKDQIDSELFFAMEQILQKPTIEEVINTLYPVGSIYITLSSAFDPNTTWNGTVWVKLKEGVFLESSSTPNSEKQAGLPNITGYFENYDQTGKKALLTTYTLNCLGVFDWREGTYNILGTPVPSGSGTTKNNAVTFDASRSSAVYGRSDTVQPHSLTVIMWQRTG